jgi:hypothetical protein
VSAATTGAAATAASRRSSALTRALNPPRPARVRFRAAQGGRGHLPAAVDGETVEALRESWLVEDRWWTAEPLRRRYWELLGARGRNMVVFHDLTATARTGASVWFVQDP